MSDPISDTGRAFHQDKAYALAQQFLNNDDAVNDDLVASLDPDPGTQPRRRNDQRPSS